MLTGTAVESSSILSTCRMHREEEGRRELVREPHFPVLPSLAVRFLFRYQSSVHHIRFCLCDHCPSYPGKAKAVTHPPSVTASLLLRGDAHLLRTKWRNLATRAMGRRHPLYVSLDLQFAISSRGPNSPTLRVSGLGLAEIPRTAYLALQPSSACGLQRSNHSPRRP